MARSKNIERTDSFDKEKLVSLIQAALESVRTQKDFSMMSGLSLSHLSRLSNGNFDSPPNKTTLRKIANCAGGNVAYEELLEAAGYAVEQAQPAAALREDDLLYDSLPHGPVGTVADSMSSYNAAPESEGFFPHKVHMQQARYFEDVIGTIFRRELEERNLRWSLHPYDETRRFDYEIRLPQDEEIHAWYIDTKYFTSFFSSRAIHYSLYQTMTIDPRQSKYSLVTNNLTYILPIIKQHFYSPLLMSVILIDMDSLSVKEEIYLDTDAILPRDLGRYSVTDHYSFVKERREDD